MSTAEQRRASMVDRQIAARGVKDPRVLQAMRTVPREDFVPRDLAEFAYEDTPLPIEAGQTISQPYIVALMVEAAQIGPDDKVLEIGVGSGYAAAVMSRLARRVHAIERHAELAEIARQRMASHGYDNVVIRTGDGTHGWPENAPFDVILVAAGAPAMPEPLRTQLAIGGRLIIPVGDVEQQSLTRVTRIAEDDYEQRNLGPVRFVRLIGAHGWNGDAGTDALVEDSQKQMFVAVYWWRVHPGKEEQFRRAWRRGTELIRERYGSYGSRLHRDADGRFVGYAEWPDEATWRAAFDQKMVYDDPETRAAFVDAIAEVPADADPIFTMTVTDDLLLRGRANEPSSDAPRAT